MIGGACRASCGEVVPNKACLLSTKLFPIRKRTCCRKRRASVDEGVASSSHRRLQCIINAQRIFAVHCIATAFAQSHSQTKLKP